MKCDGKKQKRIVAVVGVVFDVNNKVLLSQRNQPQTPYAHDKWQFPGGGMEFGEDPIETVKREVKEETGIDIELLSEKPVLHSSNLSMPEEDIHLVVLGFPARYVSGEINVSADSETKDAKWCDAEKIDFSVCIPEAEPIFKKLQENRLL